MSAINKITIGMTPQDKDIYFKHMEKRNKEELEKVEYEKMLHSTIDEIIDTSYDDLVADYLLENGVVVLPCKVGTHLFRVTYPYRKEPKVTEYVVKNFRTFGKKHKIQVEVKALNVPITNWMNYSDFYSTKEEAEQALKGGVEND